MEEGCRGRRFQGVISDDPWRQGSAGWCVRQGVMSTAMRPLPSAFYIAGFVVAAKGMWATN